MMNEKRPENSAPFYLVFVGFPLLFLVILVASGLHAPLLGGIGTFVVLVGSPLIAPIKKSAERAGGTRATFIEGHREWRSVQVALSTTEMLVSSYHRPWDERSYRTKVDMQAVRGDWRLFNFLVGLPGRRQDEDASEQERRLDTLWDAAIAEQSWSAEQIKIDKLAYVADVLVLNGHTLARILLPWGDLEIEFENNLFSPSHSELPGLRRLTTEETQTLLDTQARATL
jgi:hypothetical protein